MLAMVLGSIFIIILMVCLPKILYICLLGFVVYVILKAIKMTQLGKMTVFLTILLCLNVIMAEISPIIIKTYKTKEDIINEVEKVEKVPKRKIDKTVEDLIDEPWWRFLTRPPNEKED